LGPTGGDLGPLALSLAGSTVGVWENNDSV